MIEVYTDGSYHPSENKRGVKRKGKIAYKIGSQGVQVVTIFVPVILGLKQYSNIFELLAIAEALEKIEVYENIVLHSDSQVAVGWVNRPFNNLGQFSSFHKEMKDRIENKKKHFKGFNCSWISREKNPAGHELELPKSMSGLNIQKDFEIIPSNAKKLREEKVVKLEARIRRVVASEFKLNEYKLVTAFRYNQSFINDLTQRIMRAIEDNKKGR